MDSNIWNQNFQLLHYNHKQINLCRMDPILKKFHQINFELCPNHQNQRYDLNNLLNHSFLQESILLILDGFYIQDKFQKLPLQLSSNLFSYFPFLQQTQRLNFSVHHLIFSLSKNGNKEHNTLSTATYSLHVELFFLSLSSYTPLDTAFPV